MADTEAIAGFAAACQGQRATSAGGLSTPEQVADSMRDDAAAPPEPLNEAERRAAAAAAAWICAFTARWQVALLDQGLSYDYPHGIQVRERQDGYLFLSW